jgi:hypothetical protein
MNEGYISGFSSYQHMSYLKTCSAVIKTWEELTTAAMMAASAPP